MKKVEIKGKIKLQVNGNKTIELEYNKKGKIENDRFFPNPVKNGKSYNITEITKEYNSKTNIILIKDMKETKRNAKSKKSKAK